MDLTPSHPREGAGFRRHLFSCRYVMGDGGGGYSVAWRARAGRYEFRERPAGTFDIGLRASSDTARTGLRGILPTPPTGVFYTDVAGPPAAPGPISPRLINERAEPLSFIRQGRTGGGPISYVCFRLRALIAPFYLERGEKPATPSGSGGGRGEGVPPWGRNAARIVDLAAPRVAAMRVGSARLDVDLGA